MKPDEASALGVSAFRVTDAWRQKYPGAHAGVLCLQDVANPAQSDKLEQLKRELEEELKRRHAGQDRAGLRADAVLHAYEEHYRRFDKTYHVQLQLESILFKEKHIPSGAALVEAMFMAEIDSRLLTAGHDLAALEGRLTLDVATGAESYTLLRGTPQAPKADDMMISDESGIISSIVYGPDQRTQIRGETREAVFTVYAPPGISPAAIRAHLEQIRTYALLLAPGARPCYCTSIRLSEPNWVGEKGTSEQKAGFLWARRGHTQRLADRVAARAIRPCTQQGNGILVNSSYRGANQHPNGDGLEQSAAYPHLPHVIGQIHRYGGETSGVAGKAGALRDAIREQSPTDELAAPGEPFRVMNTGVDAVIYTQEQHPTIGIRECGKDAQGIGKRLGSQKAICLNSSK